MSGDRRPGLRPHLRLCAPLLSLLGVLAFALPTTGFARTRGPASADLGDLVPPSLLNEVTVVYPDALARTATPPRGEVVIKYTIGVDGRPSDLSVEQSVHPDLDAIALDAVGRLRYTPAELDGRKVPVINRLAIGFDPPAPPEPDPPPEPADTADTSEGTPPTDGAAPQDDSGPGPSAPNLVDPSGPVRVDGRIAEAGQRTPVEGARVVIVPAGDDAEVGEVEKTVYENMGTPAWETEAVTSADGTFEVRGIQSGKIRVIVLAPGYERLEYVESLGEGQALTVRYFLLRLATNPFRTVVRTENPREEVARRTISVEEINNLPGTQGDALKAIQNFPGVARAPFGAGLLAIRGTGPNDSAVYLGHHEIPQLFHFGGLTSVFNSDILERIDFLPGNYDSRYGDAIGGIIDVTPRRGRRDGYHGYIDSDVFDTGVLVEGPVGKGSFALSGRRSYIDLLLPAVIPDDAGLDLTVAPRYYDYQALFDYPVGNGNLSIRGFGSDDRTVLVAADPNEIETDDRDRFETSIYFHRADVVYETRHGPWEFLITPSYRYDFFDLGIGDLLSIALRVHNVNGRAEVSRRLSERAKLTVGTEFRSYFFDIDVQAPPLPDSSGGFTDSRLQVRSSDFTAIPALYTTVALDLAESFTLYPGVRFAYYSAPFNASTVDPRLRFGWQVADRTTLKGGVGLYSQSPQPVEFSDEFGNPRLGAERSIQNSLGVRHEFDYGFNLDATAFFNILYDNVAPSTQVVRQPDGDIAPENFSSTQRGRIYGLEVLARKELTKNVFGWVAYTLSRSERRDPLTGDFAVFDFDQTHILTLIGVYKFPKGWQVGGRFRLVSGNPSTPNVGAVFDSRTGQYVPIQGRYHSERFPLFHQLDLRVDKKWTFKRLSVNLYLDVQNVYNQQNVEFWQYSYDFSQRERIAGLPIIPSLGVKLEF